MPTLKIGNIFRGSRLRTLAPLGLLVSVLFVMGCEESVNPFVEEDRYFTVFGYLDTAAEEQFVRVIPLRTDLSLIHI